MFEYQEWLRQGAELGFKGFGYGKFAKGIPCSYQFKGIVFRMWE